MFPAATTMAGMCLAAPDVCKTPSPVGPVPIPYPNTAQLPMAQQTSMHVQFGNKPVVTEKSEIPQSNGDEAGVAGGVKSGMNMGPATFVMGCGSVKIEGQPCIHLTCQSAQNGKSANIPAGLQSVPSQTNVLIIP